MHLFSSYTHTNCRSHNKRGGIHLTFKDVVFESMLQLQHSARPSPRAQTKDEVYLLTAMRKSLATWAKDLLVFLCKQICTCASVYSNFNIINTQLYKTVLQYSNVADCKPKIHGEGIMSHICPCSPQGGKISQLDTICCIDKTILGGIYVKKKVMYI